ncbi:MAG: S1 RNA-binding domain-containing protein, partial [Proteobacteria bacterium]
SVHPETYETLELIAKDQNKELKDIIGNKAIVEAIPLERYVSEKVGMPTLRDIAAELIKPGRDPREDGLRLTYSDDVAEIEDLKVGMILPGTVTNVTNFGAFVDIGVHQDGLVHISELADHFVDDPSKVVSVGEVVQIRVIEVDVQRRRMLPLQHRLAKGLKALRVRLFRRTPIAVH